MGKKRHMLTLSVANITRFQTICKSLGLPNNAMSSVVDELLGDLCTTIETAQAKGTYTLKDMFMQIGEKMDDFEVKEVKKDDAQKVDAVPAKARGRKGA